MADHAPDFARSVQSHCFLLVLAVTVVMSGWPTCRVVTALVPENGLVHFVAECAVRMVVVGLLASPPLSTALRERLRAMVPA